MAQAFIRVKCNGYHTKNQHEWVGLGKTMRAANFNTRPVTPKRWQDLEAIFNSKGCSMARGCWCMYYLRETTTFTRHESGRRPVRLVYRLFRGAKKEHRGKGVASALLNGAIGYAQSQGVTILEAYPVDKSKRSRDDSMFFGPKSMYDAAGFTEVARRRPTRPIVRLTISNQRRCA